MTFARKAHTGLSHGSTFSGAIKQYEDGVASSCFQRENYSIKHFLKATALREAPKITNFQKNRGAWKMALTVLNPHLCALIREVLGL